MRMIIFFKFTLYILVKIIWYNSIIKYKYQWILLDILFIYKIDSHVKINIQWLKIIVAILLFLESCSNVIHNDARCGRSPSHFAFFGFTQVFWIAYCSMDCTSSCIRSVIFRTRTGNASKQNKELCSFLVIFPGSSWLFEFQDHIEPYFNISSFIISKGEQIVFYISSFFVKIMSIKSLILKKFNLYFD